MSEREELAALKRENQRLRQGLANLDELPREKRGGTVSDLKGVSDINSSVSKGIRSIPGGRDRYYLDLYLMQKERDRLTKESTWVKRRRTRIGRRAADIDKEMVKRQSEIMAELTRSMQGPTPDDDENPKASQEKTPKKKYRYNEEEWERLTIDY